MDKITFLKEYRAVLRIWFYWDNFLRDESITVSMAGVKLDTLLDCFVLRYKKNGQYDNRPFEDQKDDPETRLITVKEAAADPYRWKLNVDNPLKLQDLKAIPIATDTNTQRTLVLDTNHHLVNLIHNGLNSKTEFLVAHIKGPCLEKIIGDFTVLNRQ